MLKFKFGLKSKLGLIPGTSRIENEELALNKEYEEFLSYKRSNEPQRFLELEEIVTSQDFIDHKKHINSQRFKDSDAYRKLAEYNSLKKSPRFRSYFRFVNSGAFEDFQKLDNSNEIKEFEALGKKFESADYRKAEPEKFKDYKARKKSPEYKAYYKLRNSKDMEHFRELDGSPELKKFRELEKYIESDEFKETRDYLKSGDKFKKTPEYQQLLEYRELKKSPNIKWYFKLKKSGKFDELIKWKLLFSDEFTGKELDKDKWLTRFYWGANLLKQGYSLAADRHLYTEGRNIDIENNTLRLYTRKESVTGQAWDPALGFFPKDFEYTSGLINTGESFRQKYGAFEAKVRMHPSPVVYHAFWMLSDKMVPHIDIFRFMGKKNNRIELNSYWTEEGDTKEIRRNSDTVGGINFSRGFFIFRLEWYPDRLVWKVNNTIVKVETEGVPKDPMYILFSSGVVDGNGENGLPTSLDLDWVRCYEYTGGKKE